MYLPPIIDAYRYTTSGVFETIQDMLQAKDIKTTEVFIPSHHVGFNYLNGQFNLFQLYDINTRTRGPVQKIAFDKDIADELQNIVQLELQAKKRKKVIEPEILIYL